MNQYSGVPQRTFRYLYDVLRYGVLELGMEFISTMPVLLIFLLGLPEAIGYYIIAVTGATLYQTTGVLSKPSQGPTPPKFMQEDMEDMEDEPRSWIIAYVIGIFIMVATMYGSAILVASFAGWLVGIVWGYPTAGFVISALIFPLDDQVVAHTGISISKISAISVAVFLTLIFNLYGIPSSSISNITNNRWNIR